MVNLAQSEHNLFRFSRLQKLIVGGLLFLFVLLIFGRFSEIQRSRADSEFAYQTALGDYELTMTVAESVTFVDEYERWMAGQVTKRDLQIRRGLLAQRLAVNDRFGVPVGERVSSEYLKSLFQLDDIMEQKPVGFLSILDSVQISQLSKPILDVYIHETRLLSKLVLEEQRLHRAVNEENIAQHNFAYNYLLISNLLILALLLTLAVSRTRDYRKARIHIQKDQDQLTATQFDLDRSRQDAQKQRAIDEAHRLDVLRLEKSALHISTTIREFTNKEQVIDELLSGIGNSIGADIVFYHSFATAQELEVITDWPIGSGLSSIKELLTAAGERLSDLIPEIWNGSGFMAIPDVKLLNPELALLPALFEAIQKVSRAYAIVPLGEGTKVYGYVAMSMSFETREWSADELNFVERLAAEATNALLRIKSVQQTEVIAEKEEVVQRMMALDATKTKFISNVSHELRTPLTSIIGYIEFIQESADSDLDPDVANSLGIVMRNALRLQTLVENTLYITTLEGASTVFDDEDVDLATVLIELAESVKPVAQNAQVTVNLVIEDKNESLSMQGNRRQIEQLFTNLLSNAIKFTPENGTVTVTAQQIDTENGAVIVATVSDTGIGIPEEDVDGLFQRFARGSNALTAMIPGTGLGLTIVKDIVDIHRGSITFKSTVGKGTEFTVRLPVNAKSTV